MIMSVFCATLLLNAMELHPVQVQVVESIQGTTQPTQVVKDGRPVEVELRAARLSIAFPSGKVGYADVRMLYEPRTKLFWWTYQTIEPNGPVLRASLDDFAVYLTDSKIVAFNLFMSALSVRDSMSHFLSLDEGQTKILERIRENAERIENGSMTWARTIRLGPALPDFLLLKGSAAPPHAKVREVTKAPGEWRLILDGPNKNSAEVVLSDEYDLLRATVLPSEGR